MCWMSMGEPACMQLPLEGNLTHDVLLKLGIFTPYPMFKLCRRFVFLAELLSMGTFPHLLHFCLRNSELYIL